MRQNKDKDIVVFDLETTGLSAKTGDRICEIAAIRYRDFKEHSVFESLINPLRLISADAYAVNGISNDMVCKAPLSKDVLPSFLDFISDAYVGAYNIRFDLSFLYQECGDQLCQALDRLVFFDIFTLARRSLKGLASYSLASVADFLDVKQNQVHRAFSDVEISWQVLERLILVLQQKGLRSFREVCSLCKMNYQASIDDDKLSFIRRAIDFKFDILIRYFSLTTACVTERIITPKALTEEKKRKYLLGYCHLRKGERSFALDAILDINVCE